MEEKVKEKRVAFITGGTTGIGKEIAKTLAQDGFDIVINCRKEPSEFEELKNEIEHEIENQEQEIIRGTEQREY